MKTKNLIILSAACFLLAIVLKLNLNIEEEVIQEKQETSVNLVSQEPKIKKTTSEESLVEYAYSCLAESEQKVYREIYEILSEQQENKLVSTTDEAVLEKVFQCVMNDHPEIFYVEGYNYTSFNLGDKIASLRFSGTYTMSPKEVKETQKKIDYYVQNCFWGLEQGTSDFEKVKYIYEYLIENTEYDKNSKDNQNICSVFLYGKSVCQGYAQATQYLLQKAGVFCTLVMGKVENGQSHAWNLVKMDGEYYYIDTTWGDASYQLEETSQDTWSNSFPKINYDYLGVTTQQLLKTHQIDPLVPYPECTSMDCNYYIKEGTYFTDCSKEQLKEVFNAKFMQNNGYITIKCANENVYKKARSLLIEQQLVFELIGKKNGSIAYSENQIQCSLSFWI